MRLLLLALCVAVSVALTPGRASALFTFGEVAVLNSNAGSDTGPWPFGNLAPAVATDGAGVFIAVWQTSDTALVSPPGTLDMAISRSTDGGRTWAAPSVLPVLVGTYDPVVGYSSTGTWVAARTEYPTLSRSVDAGQTWSANIDLGGTRSALPMSIATDSAGTWILAWEAYNPVIQESHVHFSRSVDDGITWSPIAPLPDAMTAAEGGFTHVDLATDGAGTWICVWRSVIHKVQVSRSVDGGMDWSSPIDVSFSGASFNEVVIASGGSGNWVVAWPTMEGPLLASRSTDDGLTWESPVVVAGDLANPYDALRSNPFAAFSDGAWQLGWSELLSKAAVGIGEDFDIVGARSFDGQEWTDIWALNTNAARDNAQLTEQEINLDRHARVASAPDGSAVLVFDSTNTMGGTIGNDLDILFARSDDFCPQTPDPMCLGTTQPGSSSISYKNPAGARDQMKWKWGRGSETLLADFGSPTTTTDYAICFYDEAGGSVRDVTELHALAGRTCKQGPCWKSTSDGWKYKDGNRRQGPVRSLRLKAGGAGVASVSLKASGPSMAPPPMPMAFAPSVRVQLVNAQSGLCWESVFEAADTNTATELRARGD